MNLDLKEEFELFGNVQAEPNMNIYFSGKENLKKDILTIYNYKTHFIAYFENALNEKEKIEVDSFLKTNPAYQPEFELFKQTRLKPETEIVYDKKKNLKRGGKVISLWSVVKPVAAVAAVVVLFLLTHFLNRKEEVIRSFTVEQHEPSENKIVQIPNDSITESNPSIQSGKEPVKSQPIFKQNRKIIPLPNTQIESEMLTQSKEKETDTASIAHESNFNSDDHPILEEENNNKIFRDGITFESIEIPVISYGITAFVTQKKIVLNPLQIQVITTSGIFDEEDLKDLNIRAETKAKTNTNAEVLMELTASELNKIAKSANITFDKTKNKTSETTTYSLAFGNRFSVSHTTSK